MLRPFLLALSLAVLLSAPAAAQRFPQHARAAVEAPQLLARGGAGVALPSAETALFYNPAHLARPDLRPFTLTVLAVQGGANPKLLGDVRFLLDEVVPAVERGFQTPLSDEDRALFDRALERGARPTVGRAAVTLPQLTLRAGGVGLGAGVFATNTTRYRFEDLGGGIPLLDLFAQADLIGAAAVGAALPNTPVAVGTTARYARRVIGYKHKDLLAMDPDREHLHLIGGQTLAFDVGLHATDVAPELPGRLDVGLALYDVLGGGFTYALERSIRLGGNGAPDEAEIARVLEAFEARDGRTSFRLGAAYRLEILGPLARVALAADYVSTSSSESAQPALAKLRLGAEGTLGGLLALRAGIGQGYPSVGLGLRLPGVRLDYALFGEEDGRLPGQLPRYSHVMQVRVGL